MNETIEQRKKRFFGRYTEEKLKKFQQFHNDNPDIYKEFHKLATEMRKKRNRYSAEAIINIIRWHRDLQTTGDEFKISNDFRSIYARLLAYHHPEFETFFAFKGMND